MVDHVAKESIYDYIFCAFVLIQTKVIHFESLILARDFGKGMVRALKSLRAIRLVRTFRQDVLKRFEFPNRSHNAIETRPWTLEPIFL